MQEVPRRLGRSAPRSPSVCRPACVSPRARIPSAEPACVRVSSAEPACVRAGSPPSVEPACARVSPGQSRRETSLSSCRSVRTLDMMKGRLRSNRTGRTRDPKQLLHLLQNRCLTASRTGPVASRESAGVSRSPCTRSPLYGAPRRFGTSLPCRCSEP